MRATSEIVAVSTTQGRQYLALARTSEDVDAAIKAGQLNDLDKAAMIARLKDPRECAEAICKIEEGTFAEENRTVTISPRTAVQASGEGRLKKTVQLGLFVK